MNPANFFSPLIQLGHKVDRITFTNVLLPLGSATVVTVQLIHLSANIHLIFVAR